MATAPGSESNVGGRSLSFLRFVDVRLLEPCDTRGLWIATAPGLESDDAGSPFFFP